MAPPVGGCSFLIRVRYVAAAIASGLCDTVLITHDESGRSGVRRTRNVVSPASQAGQLVQTLWADRAAVFFTIPALR